MKSTIIIDTPRCCMECAFCNCISNAFGETKSCLLTNKRIEDGSWGRIISCPLVSIDQIDKYKDREREQPRRLRSLRKYARRQINE